MPSLNLDFGQVVKMMKIISGTSRITKGWMVGIDGKTDLPTLPPLVYQFQYNPGEKKDHKAVTYVVTKIPGQNKPLIYYSSGGERRIEFTLLLNAYEIGYEKIGCSINGREYPGFSGIKSELAKLQSFMYPPIVSYGQETVETLVTSPTANTTGFIGPLLPTTKVVQTKSLFLNMGQNQDTESQHQFATPPCCLFGWGTTVMKCIVEDIAIREYMFNEWLDPIRAEVGVKLLVDERSKFSIYGEEASRRILAGLGVTNINPIASFPAAI